MTGLKDYYHLYVIFLLSSTTNCGMGWRPSSSQAVKGAYWRSWAASVFPPSAIDTRLFTHLYYAFLVPSNVTFRFEVSSTKAPTLLNFTSTIRKKNPPAKTLFSVGGGGVGPAIFSRMASSASSRKSFIDSSIEVARKYGFDGVDLDWESPQDAKDMENLGYLLEEWRAAVQKDAKVTGRRPLLLTAATYFAVEFFLGPVVRSFPVASISKNLDFINAMCYNYHGSWDTTATGAHAALFDPKSNVSTSYGLQSWIKAGLPQSKLVMGLPLYGRTWKLKDPKVNGIGAPGVGLGPSPGPGNNGTMSYSQVETFNREKNATVVFDMETVSTYSYAGTSWIGYDDVRSTTVKIGYAQALKLRGYFFWAVNGDQAWKISRQASRSWIL
ncbi:class V chitinase CHIT5b-like [Rhododendron vialii]|uniref:class V chitinase CHIT5b-like n=1 Tax=Rhododendron vialii TaxID=182163 RepID=UPI00265E8CAA|nr:class V chitinase CHIT5b-like [Rhododendron vialii]